MRKISFVFSVILMVFLMTAPNAIGEYYQYTDIDGTVRFTDDPSLIPPEQRQEAQVYESTVSYPDESEPVLTPSEDEEEGVRDNAGMESVDEGTHSPGSGDRIEAAELDAIREQLKKAYKELEAAKNALGPPPPENAKSGVKGDYVHMSRELNLKIEVYNRMSNEFDAKVKAFNSKIGKK